MNFPVFDLHCDTALELLGRNLNEPRSLRKNDLHIDLERAKALPGYVQCFACFTTPFMQQWYNQTPETVFQKELEIITREIENNRDMIAFAVNAADIDENREKGLMSAVLTIEGPAGFGFDPDRLEHLRRIGFSITTLGWNESNSLTGSHKTGEGLTDKGREYVREAQRLGMIVDVSHISDRGFWDIIGITEKPIIASHSNSRFVCDHSRNLTDDMFRTICETGGVAGFNLYADFVATEADLDAICRHFLHFLELDPGGTHIALGGDLDGCDKLPSGFDGIQSYPALARFLRERGVDDELLYQIFWKNAMGVFERCCI